jgi:hypothetical protein
MAEAHDHSYHGFGEPEEHDGDADPLVPLPVVRSVLEEFYHSLTGEQWRNQKNWNTPYDIEYWEGTVWDKSHDPIQLVGISLPNNNLEGRIPDSIGQLKFLRFMELADNYIMGGGAFDSPYAISEKLARLPRLERLELQHNELEGRLPVNLGKTKMLTVLRLERNFIDGPIPPTIGQLTRLRFLALSDNAMNGQIPDSIGQCHNLDCLWLDNNNFAGTLPERLKHCKSLSCMNVCNNRLDVDKLWLYDKFLKTEVPDIKFYSLPQSHKQHTGSIGGPPKKGKRTKAANYSAMLDGGGGANLKAMQ